MSSRRSLMFCSRSRKLRFKIPLLIFLAYLCLGDKPSVISSFEPPKVEKRWRYFHTYDFFGPLKNLSWVRFRVPPMFFSLFHQQFLKGQSSKLIFSSGFLAEKHANLGDCKEQQGKITPKSCASGWIRTLGP